MRGSGASKPKARPDRGIGLWCHQPVFLSLTWHLLNWSSLLCLETVRFPCHIHIYQVSTWQNRFIALQEVLLGMKVLFTCFFQYIAQASSFRLWTQYSN
ncbi:hypothetical protein BO94DRAFT_347372 [Aspergillus sclerotioniger CBS 115572]|uniref:Uncharacterized protein n=1 Tax=Aspergillus sclerotioniger CBS 115572 TaxID=1450535 RepID=A0A317XAR1_9EURO|nr:hypothetical protein BO94DRAFT_347372 [Aspergillus sclerotioniger CBS 115572]PWY93610.1 hypothetical protein BO94DRAFT_347372 [Aspergillus sclerotioniger CBS 115572]